MFEDVPEDKLQELVFDSPVPVILDVAASWCQPCKYLKPILEEAVMRGGGAMRLVTIDADKRRQLVNALKVEGFPTVFAVREGRIVDKFTGVPQQARVEESRRGICLVHACPVGGGITICLTGPPV